MNYKALRLWAWLMLSSISIAVATPKDNQETYQVGITKTNAKVKIDGQIDEEVWQQASVAQNFNRKWPTDVGLAEAKTEVRLLYDDNFLYVSAVCYINQRPVIQTLKRDVGHWGSDGVAILLDPMNQRNNGFLFGVNAGGAQMEGLTVVNQTAFEWDAKWYSRVKIYQDRWVAEMAIPFKSLRYSEDISRWGINIIRNDMQRNVYSVWAKVPLQFEPTDLGFTGSLKWDTPPKKVKGNVVLIPYITGSASQDFEESGGAINTKGNAGGDAKIAVTSTLNLDLTFNPDFSQVDVDQQVTNLSRFSLFFPERRNFFLENSDLFGRMGSRQARPFFSRRVGLKGGSPVPILFGARLSGNLTNAMRIGIMDVQTRPEGEVDSLGQNNFVAAVQHRVLKRSSIDAIFVNRQAFNNAEMITSDYNRVGGLEFKYLSNNGRWRGAARGFQSFNPEQKSDNGNYGFFTFYRTRNLAALVATDIIQTNYTADLGFIPRLNNYDVERDTTVRIGYQRVLYFTNYTFYPKSGPLNSHGPRWRHAMFYNLGKGFSEQRINFQYEFNFKNRSSFRIGAFMTDVVLPFKLDLIGGDEFLPAQGYTFSSGSLNYNSDNRKMLSVNLFVRYGSFYNGTRLSYGGSLRLRKQPWGNFSVNVTQNEVELPENFGATSLTLISPTIEFSFSNTMFWTTFLQYNTQADNFNINSRFQWRYQPMSDLFIVYTDNYFANSFLPKTRALILKLSYWLNL